MKPVTIYTKETCPYCDAALDLLRKKKAAFEQIKVDGDRAAQVAMSARAGGRTSVPQIFIGGKHVGGCDDIYALDSQGRLDALLAA